MTEIIDDLKLHPFFGKFKVDYLNIIADCGSTVNFKAGEVIFKEGDSASACYVVQQGEVARELFAAGKGAMTLQTRGHGEILGTSWLFPPYQWLTDARAVSDVKAIRLDAQCLRAKCESDPVMGYEFIREFAKLFRKRLQYAQIQLLDMYGAKSSR